MKNEFNWLLYLRDIDFTFLSSYKLMLGIYNPTWVNIHNLSYIYVDTIPCHIFILKNINHDTVPYYKPSIEADSTKHIDKEIGFLWVLLISL